MFMNILFAHFLFFMNLLLTCFINSFIVDSVSGSFLKHIGFVRWSFKHVSINFSLHSSTKILYLPCFMTQFVCSDRSQSGKEWRKHSRDNSCQIFIWRRQFWQSIARKHKRLLFWQCSRSTPSVLEKNKKWLLGYETIWKKQSFLKMF